MQIKEQEDLAVSLNTVLSIFKKSNAAIRPHFILTGPSGSGKSFLIKQLCDTAQLNYLEINAAQLTKEGTSGNSLAKALAPYGNTQGIPTVCFVDEFDKLFISGNFNTDIAHETTNGVQNEFLTLLESSTTEVFGDYGKYTTISISNVLFVFAGAFNGEEHLDLDALRRFGLKTEFLGRVGIVFNAKKVTLESLKVILENSSLIDSYVKVYPSVDKEHIVTTVFTELEKNYAMSTIGVRLITTLIHQYFIYKGDLAKIPNCSQPFHNALSNTPPKQWSRNKDTQELV